MRVVFDGEEKLELRYYKEEDKLYKGFCDIVLKDRGNPTLDKKSFFVPEVPGSKPGIDPRRRKIRRQDSFSPKKKSTFNEKSAASMCSEIEEEENYTIEMIRPYARSPTRKSKLLVNRKEITKILSHRMDSTPRAG